MPNNFSYLLSIPSFSTFAPAAVAAERIFAIDAAACALNCRKAMELSVKWMYSVDEGLWAAKFCSFHEIEKRIFRLRRTDRHIKIDSPAIP